MHAAVSKSNSPGYVRTSTALGTTLFLHTCLRCHTIAPYHTIPMQQATTCATTCPFVLSPFPFFFFCELFFFTLFFRGGGGTYRVCGWSVAPQCLSFFSFSPWHRGTGHAWCLQNSLPGTYGHMVTGWRRTHVRADQHSVHAWPTCQ